MIPLLHIVHIHTTLLFPVPGVGIAGVATTGRVAAGGLRFAGEGAGFFFGASATGVLSGAVVGAGGDVGASVATTG